MKNLLVTKKVQFITFAFMGFYFRKWAKSTLFLVPLFGVHYIVFSWISFVKDETIELVWLFWDQLFGSCQVRYLRGRKIS